MSVSPILRPDSPLVDSIHPSPNVEPRQKSLRPTLLILHYTGLPTVEQALDVLSRPDCKVSCHYVVTGEGRIIQMVAETARAWHAGVSSWDGETDINSASIGIEIHNPGHQHGYPEFPRVQMEAVAALARDIVFRHRIRPRHVLAHSDVAPGRKIDPGEKFDWQGLAARGVGHWVPPADLQPGDDGLELGSQSPLVREAQMLLRQYGYGVETHGTLDEPTSKVVRAFQLHFRQARPDGRLDNSTLDTLARLVAGCRTGP